MSATALSEPPPTAVDDGMMAISTERLSIPYQWDGMHNLANPLDDAEFGPTEEKPNADTWPEWLRIWKSRADAWLEDWEKSKGQYRRKISLIQSGLQHFDPRILRMYILMADGHERQDGPKSKKPSAGLSAAAFKALCNHVFPLDPYSDASLSVTIEHRGACSSWQMLTDNVEMLTLFAWFFRRRHGHELDNYFKTNRQQYEVMSAFYRSFVLRHWSRYCDSQELTEINHALESGRAPLLRSAYETGFWFNDPSQVRWRISAMDFAKFLAPGDLAVLEELLVNVPLNGYRPEMGKVHPFALAAASNLTSSASMVMAILGIARAAKA